MWAAALVLLGCGDVAPAPGGAAQLVLVGDSGADTIGAILAHPLVVQVRAGDTPDTGVYLVFDASLEDSSQGLNVSIARGITAAFSSRVELRTDSLGVAQVFVCLGRHAGNGIGTVKVSAPDIGLAATATYTVLPGKPWRIVAAPRDTVVYVGGTAQFHVTMTDRAANPLPDTPPAFVGNGVGYSITSSGLATGLVVSRNQIDITSGSAFDSVYLSVAPHGTVVGIANAKLVRLALDGSGYTVLADALSDDYGVVVPVWSPAGDSIAYSSAHRLYVVSANGGAPRRLILNPPASLGAEVQPHYSSDGATIFFSGRASLLQHYSLWSVRTDGTGLTSFGPAPADTSVDWQPAPSPDGSRVAFGTYVSDPIIGVAFLVKVLTLADGAVANWSVRGTSPIWSKDGSTIVYVSDSYYKSAEDGFVHAVNPDGTADRVLSTAAAGGPLSWSPDGQWVGAGGFVVQLSTGFTLRVPLPVSYPTWRPVP